jgi:hypothetical protein
MQLLRGIFDLFKAASGLGYNLAKCQMAAIRCDEAQIQLAPEHFPCQMVDFLVKYLGMPLSPSKLPKLAWWPLMDQAADRLLVWKGKSQLGWPQALPDQSWIRDITGTVLMQYLELRQWLQQCSMQSGVPDCFVWKWCSSGTYSSAFAYRALFIGQLATLGAKELWRSRTPNNSLLCLACHPQTLEG